MKTSDFNYHLPPELIAQTPLERRDSSRLLCLNRLTGATEHRTFADILPLLRQGDRLVLNDTRVIPARIFCRKSTGARIELLFVQRIDDATWIAIGKPGKRLQPGMHYALERQPAVSLMVDEVMGDGSRRISLIKNELYKSIDALLEVHGEMPLPPYIDRPATASDRERYQTVFARNSGAVAAPTASLHFTSDLLSAIAAKGIDISYVTLHVGIGTFKPVSEDDPLNHHMHEEYYDLSQATVDEIAATKNRGGRVIAAGTTVVRVLEHCAAGRDVLEPSRGTTRIFILPGFRFNVIDALITNFHLPQSTLLMLVSAFAGHQKTMAAYGEAVKERYRFFSYGDAMFIA